MKAVTFEQSMDRYVEERLLDLDIVIAREVSDDDETWIIRERGRRNANANSEVVGKVYTVAEGCELLATINGAQPLYLEAGDQIELNMTLHNARGTGIRIIRGDKEDTSPNRALSLMFESIHSFTARRLPSQKRKK